MNYLEYDDEAWTEEDYFMDVDDEQAEEEDEAYEDVNEMLDALMDEADMEDDLAERRGRRRSRKKRRPKRKVSTAKGRSAYRPPVLKGYVTQKQMKDALGRVGKDIRRNASGIKTVNTIIGRVNTRLDGVVSVNKIQSREILSLNKRFKMDGALEFAESYNPATAEISLYQLFKGAVKSGMLGDTKGALSNPLVVGGIGLLLNNPAILSGVFGGGRTP